MTLPIGRTRARNRSAGFTLIEFILVMTLLMVVFGVAAPSLSKFFKGRTLDAEARRFLALTRYAQSRAVSESVPVILWVDVREKTYGIEQEYSYEQVDPRGVTYELNPELEMEAVLAPVQARNISPLGQSEPARRNLPMVRFQPEGLSTAGTMLAVELRELDDQERVVWIAPDRSGLRYEIQTNLLLFPQLN